MTTVQKVQEWFQGAWESQVLRTSVKLGVFDHLPATTETLVHTIPANSEGIFPLLQALKALGFADKKEEIWENTALGALFRRDAEIPYWAWVMHQEKLHRAWARFSDFVKSGKEGLPAFTEEPTDHLSFIGTMDILGMERAKDFWESVPVQAAHLLDLGGGGGRYGATALQLFPDKVGEVTIFDDPRSYEWFQRIKAELDPKLQTRFHFKGGNFLTDTLEISYNVILASNIFHIYDPSQSRIILNAAKKALSPEGRVIVQDWFFEEPISPMPALFHINMLLNTPNGRVHDKKEFLEIVKQSGLELESWISLDRDAKAVVLKVGRH